MGIFQGFKKNIIKSKLFVIAALHLVALGVLSFILGKNDLLNIVPNNQNLLNWDGIWYQSIKESGYIFVPFSVCNMAFSPMFPFIWRLLGLTPFFVSIFNLLIFVSSFFFLLRHWNAPPRFFFLILSIPSFIFFSLPYSESLFFLFSAFIIRGYQKNSLLLKCIGFFFASITRTVSLIFIPAIIIADFLTVVRTHPKNRNVHFVLTILSCVFGLLITSIVQGYQTGKWFYFLEIQKQWGREWIIPSIPFTTYRPEWVMGIDGIAFAIGLLAILYCLALFACRIDKDLLALLPTLPKDSALVMSALYLAATTVLDTLFTFYSNGYSNIWSINRHVLCTPFVIVFIMHWYKFIDKRTDLFVLIILLLSVIFTGVYKHPFMLAHYFVFFLPFMFLKFHNSSKQYVFVGYIINCICQLLFFEAFLNNKWVG